MNRDLTNHNKRIAELQVKIDAEARKLQAASQATLSAIQARVNDCRAKLSSADDAFDSAHVELDEHTASKDEAEKRLQASQKEAAQLQKQVVELDEGISRCQAQQLNGLAVYGNNIKAVIQAIRDEAWFGKSPPIGPLGLFVELKDKKWAPPLKAIMGNTMMSFAVSDVRDRAKLKKILDRTNKYVPP